jgi:hypothetical protein
MLRFILMKWYFSIVLITVLSVIGLAILVVNFDPFTASRLIKILFFSSLFLAAWGMAALIFTLFTVLKHHSDLYVPLRRGFLVATALVGFVVLARMGKFDLWAVMIIIFVEIVTEFFIHRYSRYSNVENLK